MFKNNSAGYGGAIYTQGGFLAFSEVSVTEFNNNTATKSNGGAIYSTNSDMYFKANSIVEFSHNTAASEGGALYFLQGTINFEGYSNTRFIYNTATNKGGAIYAEKFGHMHHKQFAATVFRNNVAKYGGAIFAKYQSSTMLSNSSTIIFANNTLYVAVYIIESRIVAIQNFTIIFNNLRSTWCNKRCLPHPKSYKLDINDSVVINSNGVVWCIDKKNFKCESTSMQLEHLLDKLKNTTIVNIIDNATLSSVLKIQYVNNISIIGHNITILCTTNKGSLYVRYCSNLTIKGITWTGCGTYEHVGNHIAVIGISWSCGIMIEECTFQYSLGKVLSLVDVTQNINISNCSFMNSNGYSNHGAAIYYSLDYYTNFSHIMTINNCNFSYNDNAKSIIYFGSTYYSVKHVYLKNLSFNNNKLKVHLYIKQTATSCISAEKFWLSIMLQIMVLEFMLIIILLLYLV